MRRMTLLTALVLTAAPAAAQRPQADPRIVVREQTVVRDSRAVREIARAYQGRNNRSEQTERFSRKIKIGRDGRVTVDNISGNMTVTTGGGDELSIEAVKRTRGPQSELANVRIIVDERAGRVDIRTEHERNYRDRDRDGDHVSVDYTLVVPSGVAIGLHSISGNLGVTGARGSVRAETVSGDVTMTDVPKVELAKSISGNVTLTGVSTEGDLAAGSVSGNVIAKSLKAHGLDVNSISGNVNVTDVTCERVAVKTVNGSVEYTGTISKGGTYDFNIHSGSVRLTLENPAGFVLNANSFSGSIRSDLPLTIGGDSSASGSRNGRTSFGNRRMRATYGDGSATVTVRTFSGDIIIAKR